MDTSGKLSLRALVGILPVLLLLPAACSGPPRHVASGARRSVDAPAPPSADADRKLSASAKKWSKVYDNLLGIRYAYGGSSRKGFDCSGLVQYSYQKFDGRRLPRTVRALAYEGKHVEQSHLRVGDLVFYDTGGRKPSHVGIYLGQRRFLHASNSGGVEITSMDDSYYARRYFGARRLP